MAQLHRGTIGVLAVVAAFTGGFVAGRAADEGKEGPTAIQSVAADEPVATPQTAVAADGAGSSSAAGAPVRQRLFRRTAADGYSVRVFRNDTMAGAPACGGTDWCPPPECNPSTYIEAQSVGEWAVAQGGGPLRAPRGDAPALVVGTLADWYSDDTMFGVIVHTTPAVSSVRLSYEGHTDEMTPVDGIAVLVVADPRGAAAEGGQPYPASATVEVVVDGAVEPLSIAASFAVDPACTPPPPAPPKLPPAGEQPADVAAADAAVRAVFQSAFGAGDDAAKDAAVDDPTGLRDLGDELEKRYPEMLGGRVTYEVTEIVFTGPEAAAFYFRPVITDYNELPRQIGHARVVDGEWKVTRATVCAMFQLGGVTC